MLCIKCEYEFWGMCFREFRPIPDDSIAPEWCPLKKDRADAGRLF
jgi:hypothetical protein